MAKYTSWDDWFASVTDPSPGEVKKKKKKKEPLGPVAPLSYQPISIPGPAPAPPSIPQKGAIVPIELPSMLGEGGSTVIPASPDTMTVAEKVARAHPGRFTPDTPEEQAVRNANLGYFAATGRLPSPDKVKMMLTLKRSMTSGRTSPARSAEEYKKMWEGAAKLGPELGLANGDFYQDTGYQNMHGLAELGLFGTSTDNIPADAPAPTALVKESLRIVRRAKPNPTLGEAALMADPNEQILAHSEMLADRLRRRGAPVEWDTDKPWKDPAFFKASITYAFGRQWAFSLWGSDGEKKTADDTIAYLRSLPISGNQWDQLGQKLGVGMADWSKKETFGLVLDAMRSTDTDLVHNVAYDSWMFGRPDGQSPSQARVDYANHFGAERLPLAERTKYEQSDATLLGVIAQVSGKADAVWEWSKRVPVIGDVLAPIGYVAGNTTKAFNYPLQVIMSGLVAAYDMTNQADPKRGLSLIEYQKAMGQGQKFGSSAAPWDLQWSVLTDTSRWAQAYEEAQGKTPISAMAQNLSLSSTGHVSPLAKDIGDLADFSVMFYLGAKVGDPLFRYGTKTAMSGTFKAGRFAEAKLYTSLSDARAARLANEANGIRYANSFGFHIPKDEMAKLSAADRVKVEAHQARIEELANWLEEDARVSEGRAVKSDAAAAGNLDQPTTYEQVREYITSRGGLKKNAETWGETGRLSEKNAQAHGLVRKPREAKKGGQQSVDEIVQELAYDAPGLHIHDANDLLAWLDENKPAKGAKSKAEPKSLVDKWMTELTDHENALDAVLAKAKAKVEVDTPIVENPSTGQMGMIEEGRQTDLGLDEFAGELPRAAEAKPVEPLPGQTSIEAPQWKMPRDGEILDPEGLIRDHPKAATLDVTMTPKEWVAESRETQRLGHESMGQAGTGEEFYSNEGMTRNKYAQEAQNNPVRERLANGDPVDPPIVDAYLEPGKNILRIAYDSVQDGEHRGLVAIELGIKEIPVKVRVWVREGRSRRPATPEEMAGAKFERSGHPEKWSDLNTGPAVESAAPDLVGQRVRFKGNDTVAPGGRVPEQIDTIIAKETLPSGAIEYQLKNGGYLRPEDIIGPERRTGPRETSAQRQVAAPTVNEQGVKVAEVRKKDGTTFESDANIAEDMQRLNDGDYPTYQSHGGPEGHPKTSDAVKQHVEPYVEFLYRDLKVDGSVKTKAGLIRAAAKRAGAEVETRKAPSTIIVKGDVKAFTDELMGPQPPKEPPVAVRTPSGADPLTPLRNAMFRTNAEVISVVDDPALISALYQIPESNKTLNGLVREAAAAKDPAKVEGLLRQMEEHGVEIDGGAGAVIKNMRQASYRNGFGHRNFLRFFITPTNYGRTHGIDGSTDATYNYMVASKLGMSTIDDAGWAQVRALRRELWEEQSPLKKRTIVDRIGQIIDDNITREHGSLKGLEKYTSVYHRVQGRAIMSGARRAYYGVMKDGKPVEGSIVSSPTRARTAAQSAVEVERARVAELTADATPAFKSKVETALAKAEKDALDVEKAITEHELLSAKETLSPAEYKRLKATQKVIDSYGAPVPMKMGQAATHIVFRHNPRILASYMSGPTGQALAIADQAVFQPLMTVFKETVMSALGFPIRVNIGDEWVRLIPEGTLGRMKEAKALKAQAKSEGLWGDDLDAEIQDKLAYDWVASDSGDWILVTKDSNPRYFQYLAQDLSSWRREPIVQRLLEENGGVFPEDPGDMYAFIAKIADEESDLGKEMRQYLDDTYRYENGIDNAAFTEWTGLWQDRMEAIGANPTLRRSMSESVSAKDLQAGVRDEELWPVNAPEQMHLGSKPSLNWISYANPFHYIYQGVPIGGGRRVGSLQLLGAMSNKLRETMFADRYYLERKGIAKTSPHLLESSEGRLELHNTASERAMAYTNKVTYSRSTTMFEDMTRNLIPFGNAYRQFWQYWLATFAKHPFSMSAYMEGYPKAQESAFGIVGAGSQAVGGPEVSMKGQFLGIGDYQAFIPPIPFLAVQDQGTQGGTAGTIASNLPQSGFLVTAGARTLMGAVGMNPEDYSTYPLLAGLSPNMAPFGRQAKLLYGLTGWHVPGTVGGDQNTTLVGLFGDPAKLDKAHANAILAQLHYDPKTDKTNRDKPIGWRAAETLFGLIGMHNVKPEALFAEGWKIFVPSPASASYSPKETRDKGNWLFEYYDKVGKGDSAGAATLRADTSWLDTYLTYYDADEAEKLAMKRDPANTDMLKFWVSPYDYSRAGAPLEGLDWQDQFTTGKVSYKSEGDYVTSINNLYVDIHGGTYMQSAYRQGGQEYKGDSNRAQAEKATKAKITAALKWAKVVSGKVAKANGWDKTTLMYQFQNPDENWGIWPSLLKANGLDPNQYNVTTIAKVFASKYGEEYKMSPQYLSSDNALRALDMAQWIPSPAIRDRLLTETPFVGDLKLAEKEKKNIVARTAVESAALGQWYWLGSQQLNAVGIKASPQIDTIQLTLHSDYLALQKLTTGSSEYKAARTAYYKKRDKLLGSVRGGAAISGGVADRLAALPFVLTPQVTLMGTGKGAVSKQKGYDGFAKVVKAELAKDNPNPEHLNMAWDKLVGYRKYDEKQQSEALRTSAWAYLLASAKQMRYDMRHHYSDYYKAPGESSTAKYGKQKVAQLNKITASLRRYSPAFSKEIDDWFGTDANVGTRFLNWYNY